MDAKKFLGQYTAACVQLRAFAEERQRLWDLAESCICSMRMLKDSSAGDGFAGIIIKLSDLDRQIEREISSLSAVRREVCRIIDLIPSGNIRTLMRMRYISGYKWERIAHEMNYDIRWVYRMHGKGLSMVAGLICDKNTPC